MRKIEKLYIRKKRIKWILRLSLFPSYNSSQSYKSCSHGNDCILSFLSRYKIHLPDEIQKLQGADTMAVPFKSPQPIPHARSIPWWALSICWVTRDKTLHAPQEIISKHPTYLTNSCLLLQGPIWTMVITHNQCGRPRSEFIKAARWFPLKECGSPGHVTMMSPTHRLESSTRPGKLGSLISYKLPGDVMLLVTGHTWASRDLQLG